ncbi:hypothetical protein SASPL_135848 [Salvia splendens]|uniref:Uncharacterized protein n=2 Tax=Salvia splendens TaxID=180675 RepID=A0A8X8ZG45_SALSN|nr:hypothetical protein SASPL_135848 [Salvia splendens]
MRRPSTLQETFAIANKLDQRQPSHTTAFPVVNREPNCPSPQQNEEVAQEVELVDNDVLVDKDCILNSSRVADVKNAWGNCEESTKKIHTSLLNLEVESPTLIAEILHTGNTGLPCRTVDSASSFKMLRNCMADPDDYSIDVSNVVRRRYDPSYYTIYLEETSEYKLHEDEHGKEYVWCVAVSNRWGIFFKFRLFKVHDMYYLDFDEFSVVDAHSSALYFTKSDLLDHLRWLCPESTIYRTTFPCIFSIYLLCFPMRLHSLSLSLVFLLLCLLTFCNAAFEIAGSAQCADCELNNFKTAHAFSGLHVTIDCKVEKEIKRVGKGELDADGKFKISLPKEIIVDVKNKHCFAQLHSAATPCPGVGATQIVFKSQIDGKVTFTPKEALTFSTALCTSKFLWPFFEYPPLPKTYSWKKHWPQITIPPLKKHHWKKVWPKITIPHPIVKTLPPPVPIYKPKPKIPVVKPLPPSVPVYKPKPKLPVVKPHPPSVPIYKPKPKIPVVKPLPPSVPVYKPKPKLPVVKPHPPSVPVYKPKIPVVKPLPPSVPVYKPKPKLPVVKPHPPSVPVYKPKPKPKIPVVKPLPPSVPIYKPKPKLPVVKPHPPSVPIYKPKPKIPVVKPLPPSVPIYNPKPPVKHLPPHVPIYKPPTKPIPHPFHKPPVVKPSVPIYKPLPPLFPLPPFYKKPCPPFSKFPPKSYGHPKFGYFPKFPPFKPIP